MLSGQGVRTIAQPQEALVLCESLGRVQDKGLLNDPLRRLGLGGAGLRTAEVRRLQENLKTPPIAERRQTDMCDGLYHPPMSS